MSWRKFVSVYAKQHSVTYAQAMQDCSGSDGVWEKYKQEMNITAKPKGKEDTPSAEQKEVKKAPKAPAKAKALAKPKEAKELPAPSADVTDIRKKALPKKVVKGPKKVAVVEDIPKGKRMIKVKAPPKGKRMVVTYVSDDDEEDRVQEVDPEPASDVEEE